MHYKNGWQEVFLASNQILIMIFNNKGIESTCGLNVYSAVA